MIRIDELLRELCPHGVVYRPLADVASTISGLSGKTKADFSGGSARYITYKNVHANPAIDEAAADFVVVEHGENQNRLRQGDVLITNSSEDFDDVGISSVVMAEPREPLYLNSFCFALRFADPGMFLPEFSKHLFRSEPLRKQVRRAASGVTRINVSKARFMAIKVPMLSLEVQREIVRVLDRYSSLKAELTRTLQTELEARRRQYEFLVSQIIAGIDSERETLRDLGVWRGGVTPSKAEPRYWESGTIPWLASMDVSESEARVIRGRVTPVALAETSLRAIPPASVVVVMRSNILRNRLPIGLTTVEATLNQDLKALLPRNDVDPGYVFQVLRALSDQIRIACVRTDGSMAAVDSKAFLDWSIPVPPVQDQRHIATQVRAFDAAVGELGSTLAAELAARREQYDHYRDRLLTFKESAA